ncbi:MAG: hypothetical protein WAQ25_05000 [Candidatus Saccharimonas sp.]
MIILWDSSTAEVRLSVLQPGSRRDYAWQAGRSLARDMHTYLRDRLNEHDATLSDITAIGVYQGPGSFTGLRIGLSVLNTLATALSVPIVGATGENWQSVCLQRLNQGEDDKIVLPEYGADAATTKPRK